LTGFSEDGPPITVPMVDAVAFAIDTERQSSGEGEALVLIGMKRAASLPNNRLSLMATFEARESRAMVNDLHPDHGGRPEIVVPAEDEGQEDRQISMTALGRYVGLHIIDTFLVDQI